MSAQRKPNPPEPGEEHAEEVVRHRKVHNHGGHEEEHEEGEPWLLSYADMVTLLMCFFVLFFSLDKSKGGINDAERVKAKLESLIAVEVGGNPGPSNPSSASSSKGGQAGRLQKAIKQELKQVSKAAKVVFAMANPEPGVVEITFLNADFFSPGKVVLSPTGVAMVNAIVPRLKALSEGTKIEVQGHTDSDKLTQNKFYPSNWELSTARASAVARQLMDQGIDPKWLMVSGFGEHRPILPEINSLGQVDTAAKKINRRVIIRVHIPLDEKPEEEEPVQAKPSPAKAPPPAPLPEGKDPKKEPP